ncbi:MAG TPA: dephospho-CoA kinase [bacterium]|nr:dephospho-CoA kinase [bacterium]
MRIIGLTGTIGSGKSAVAGMLAELGAEVIDTDKVAREVVEPGTPGLKKLVETWGESLLTGDGSLDREKLAAIVFADEGQRRRLNSILHPMIGAEVAARLAASRAPAVVLEVPLLFESGFDKMAHECWVVTADEDSLPKRIAARDGAGEDAARARITSQMSQEEKARRADVVIDNSGTLAQTRTQVAEAWRKIEKL